MLTLVFWYVMRNKYSYQHAKNQTTSGDIPEFMAKKLLCGHPRYTASADWVIRSGPGLFWNKSTGTGVNFQILQLVVIAKLNRSH